tara:strand:- start:717 stop:959 length:243 start_codon:yes stop_codon:yes gene_type:complete
MAGFNGQHKVCGTTTIGVGKLVSITGTVFCDESPQVGGLLGSPGVVLGNFSSVHFGISKHSFVGTTGQKHGAHQQEQISH